MSNKTHVLKSDPESFQKLLDKVKCVELRYNDRNYQVGDLLYIRETLYSHQQMLNGEPLLYTKREVFLRVTDIADDLSQGLQPGWVAMSFVFVSHKDALQEVDHRLLPGFVKPDTDKQVFFYEQDFYVLSNFSAFAVRHCDILFMTSEHAYHWEKFISDGPSDSLTLQRRSLAYHIRTAKSAHEAFKLAEANKHLRRPDWDAVKVNVMRTILREKLEQHEYVRRKLLQTGDRELIEDSWRDSFWGWGPNQEGVNKLGQLWMELRAELRAKEASNGS